MKRGFCLPGVAEIRNRCAGVQEGGMREGGRQGRAEERKEKKEVGLLSRKGAEDGKRGRKRRGKEAGGLEGKVLAALRCLRRLLPLQG